MTDENASTADLTIDDKLNRILSKLGDLDTRLTTLESQGANVTRPQLDQIVREMVITRSLLSGQLDGIERVLVSGNQEAQGDFNRDHAAFSEQMPRLRDTINAALGLIHNRDLTWYDAIVLSLARMAFEDFRQILLLCSNGETTGGMKILRGMFERVVTATYLDKNPEEADAFINFYAVARYKEANAARAFLSEKELQEIKAERDKVIGQYEIRERRKGCNREEKRINHSWTRVDIPTMAEMTGLKLPMVPGYYLPMQETHATLASISRRLNFNGSDQSIMYDDTSTLDESQITLSTAHYLALAAIQCLRDRFKLGDLIQNQFSQCLEGFNQVLTATGVVVDDKRKSSTDETVEPKD